MDMFIVIEAVILAIGLAFGGGDMGDPDMGAQPDQQQQETLEQERFHVEHELLATDGEYNEWLDRLYAGPDTNNDGLA